MNPTIQAAKAARQRLDDDPPVKARGGRTSSVPNAARPAAEGISIAVREVLALQNRYGMTDRTLSRLAGYDISLPGQWRRGDRTPNLQTLEAYAQVFGMEVRLIEGPLLGGVDLPVYVPKFLKPRRAVK